MKTQTFKTVNAGKLRSAINRAHNTNQLPFVAIITKPATQKQVQDLAVEMQRSYLMSITVMFDTKENTLTIDISENADDLAGLEEKHGAITEIETHIFNQDNNDEPELIQHIKKPTMH